MCSISRKQNTAKGGAAGRKIFTFSIKTQRILLFSNDVYMSISVYLRDLKGEKEKHSVAFFISNLLHVDLFIKSPKRSAELSFFSLFLLLPLLFLLPKFCLAEISVTTRRSIPKFNDVVDMFVKLCNTVFKFNMVDYKAGIRSCPKPPVKFRLFLIDH